MSHPIKKCKQDSREIVQITDLILFHAIGLLFLLFTIFSGRNNHLKKAKTSGIFRVNLPNMPLGLQNAEKREREPLNIY